MFSYTDEAIVTSSPTGRHLSTVIRALPGVPTDLWRQHAEAVCKVLNGLRPTHSVAEALQVCGRFHDEVQFQFVPFSTDCPLSAETASALEAGEGLHKRIEEWLKAGVVDTWIGRQGSSEDIRDFAQRAGEVRRDALIESLERELADAHEKLREPIRMSRQALSLLSNLDANQTMTYKNRTFKRVE